MTHRTGPAAPLVSLGPAVFLLATMLSPPRAGGWPVLALAAAGLVAGGGFLVSRHRRVRFAAVLAGIGTLLVAVHGPLLGSPVAAFLVLAGVALLLDRMAFDDDPRERPDGWEDRGARRDATVSAGMALALWLLVVVGRADAPPWGAVAMLAAVVIAWSYGTRWVRRRGRRLRLATTAVAGAALAGAAIALARHHPRWAATCLVLPPAFVLATSPPSRDEAPAWLPDLDHPVSLLVTTFASLAVAGGLLLMLPLCAADGHALSPLDAFFTATSAVCVTGLIVRDTATAFSPVGQALLLLLIQVGGLGIMTFSAGALGMLGRRLSLRHEGAMAELVSHDNRRDLFRVLRATFALTAVIEIAGAAGLAVLFQSAGDPVPSALWRGLFTSISAFCNAGFALQTDSLIPYRENPWILHAVALLIGAGGLSPLVLSNLPRLALRRRVPVQVKVALGASAVLWLAGFVLFAALEWGGALAALSPLDRLHNAWFQSVTARTAGFNSVDLAACGDAAVTFLALLMFVGGCPGSTAGGIKTTTLVVIAFGVAAGLRGRPEPEMLGRRISRDTFQRATSILVLGLASLAGGVLALQITHEIPYRLVVFEVVSALGTVGLSLGATPALDEAGRVILMLCMLAGRVGPLSAFLFFVDRRPGAAWEYPAEDLEVG